MSFEEGLAKLELIVKKMENGQETLESSIVDFEHAIELKAFCQKKLESAKLKISQIVQNSSNDISLEEVDLSK